MNDSGDTFRRCPRAPWPEIDQRERQLGHVGVPLAAVLFEAPQNDPRKTGGRIGSILLQWLWHSRRDFENELRHGWRRERRTPRDEFVENDADRPNVRASVD